MKQQINHMNAPKTCQIAKAKQKLAAGVLMQARQDLHRFHRATKAVDRDLYYDAYHWVMSDSCRWRFSFLNVCKLLNLAPEEIRGELLGETSLGALHYWSRRFARVLRRLQISVGEILAGERATEITGTRTLVHKLS